MIKEVQMVCERIALHHDHFILGFFVLRDPMIREVELICERIALHHDHIVAKTQSYTGRGARAEKNYAERNTLSYEKNFANE